MKKTYKAGDIIKVPIDYTDKTGSKGRPALIISKLAANNPDYIVLPITRTKRSEDIQYPIDNTMISNGKLPALCSVRFTTVFTTHHKLILGKYGELNNRDLGKIISKFKEILY